MIHRLGTLCTQTPPTARADYQFFAANPDKGFPAELWVRKDLIGLRASLPGGGEGGAAAKSP